MLRKVAFMMLLLAVLLSMVSVTLAQDMKVIATGLNNPRHLFYADDGTLYIVEAGKGGDTNAEGPYGPVKTGNTGQVTVVSPAGEQSVLISGLISMDAEFGQIEGPTSIYVADGSYWLTLGMSPTNVAEGQHAASLVQYSGDTPQVGQVFDVQAWEVENNPDKTQELVSNPIDLAMADDGTVYVADASGNSVLTWTEGGGPKLFASWTESDTEAQPVPTTVALGPNSDVYISFLTGYPFEPGSSRIEVYGSDGTLKTTYENLSFVTDVLVTDDGSIYAVEFSSGFGDTGWIGDSGRIVKVSDGDNEVIADGLNFPYGIALSPNGELVASINSFGMGADGKLITDQGEVVVVASL
jgi:hypothetical protein